jgi:hypothetical protein
MAGVAITACSSSLDKKAPGDDTAQVGNSERVGTLGLALQPVAGITVSNVHYTVTAGNAAGAPIVSEGNLPTPGTADDFSFGIPLPVGEGYYISLSGESAETGDNITCTGSYGPFGVTPNTTTPFNMVLTCVDNTNGQIVAGVQVATDACPRLVVDYAVAEPGTATAPGGEIDVHAAAHNLDAAAPAGITFAWSIVNPLQAGVGQFAPANAADSVFTCADPGDSVTIRVTATNYECSKSLDTVISCASLTCGNGIVEPALGETCDWGVDAGCPSDCTKVCGDGNPEGSETCDPSPADPAHCWPAGTATECTIRTPECGDGFVTSPEACDTLGNVGPGGVPLPDGSTCNAGCGGITGPVCGDGSASGTEECDGGTGTAQNPVPATSRECTYECERIATAECVTCEQGGNCVASSDNCLGPTATPFTVEQQLACTDLMQCIQDSNCLDGTGSLGKCYCGTLDTAACGAAPYDLNAAGAPNGPCAALMQAGSPALTTNSQILGGLTAKSRPGGAAGQRLNCQKNDATCGPICGITQ